MFYLYFYFIITLLFNYIHLVQCLLSGTSSYKSYYANTKLYYAGSNDFFYIDLTNLPLNENTVIDSSKWIQLNYSIILIRPFLGGKANDKFFFSSFAFVGNSNEVFLETFDTTLNKWDKDINFTGKPSKYFESFDDWVSDKNTGKVYSLQQGDVIDIFDTVNLVWTNSSLVPQVYQDYTRLLRPTYDPPQVILPNGQILYFPSEIPSFFSQDSNATMNSILTYNIVANSWQPINTTGQAPSIRSGYTAVLTSDGRIIIYGGMSNNLAATPSIVVLNTSTYEWSTPTEANPIGPLASHTSTIVDNYMVTSFGIIVTKKNLDRGPNKNVYKLDISNPSTYKWSILSTFNDNSTKPSKSPFPSPSTSPHTSPSNNLTTAIGVTTSILLIVHFIFWWVVII
ncbi:galactose oxidase [Gigaspora margarita]|uniref:Galactose oxidase n=1 Tax=Gigaspora margarita TaxID=4874 RepID=A0A8H4AV98_GIGMA|nr:galactose oxidase [Gigaspora margarita]